MGRHHAPEPTPAPTTGLPAVRSAIWRKVLFGALAVVVLGGSLAFAAAHKKLTLVIDGKAQTISTYATTVGQVVDDAHVTVSDRDLVTPSVASAIENEQTVSVVHARPVQLTVDGTRTTKWIAALTVDEALSQLGLSGYGTSVSRSTRIGLDGTDLSVTAPKTIAITVDGATTLVQTNAATVLDAIFGAGIPLSGIDEVSVPREAAPVDGMQISITRVTQTIATEDRVLPYTVVEQPNPDQYIGIDSVLTPGVNGTQRVQVLVTANGAQTTKTDLQSVVLTAAVDQVVAKGTKAFPANVDALNWNALATCESTNNPKAVNKTNGKYFGLYQFSVETWASVGGSGNPVDATAEEQLARAKMLFMRSGAGQWECGGHLYD